MIVSNVVTLADRPDLVEVMWSMENTWPTFMSKDPIAHLFYGQLAQAFPEYQLLALDEHEAVIGRINSVPFTWSGRDDELPERGWDAILEQAFCQRDRRHYPTAVSLLEARIVPHHQGAGLSSVLLRAAQRAKTRDERLVRPGPPHREKPGATHPDARIRHRVRSDGLPADPWLRVHARLGARIVRVCPLSMTVPGTLEQWREWTGLPLTSSGPVDVPGP